MLAAARVWFVPAGAADPSAFGARLAEFAREIFGVEAIELYAEAVKR